MSEVPPGWAVASLQNVCTSITDGDHQPPPKSDRGIPFLVISNVRTGRPDFASCRHVPPAYYYALHPTRRPREDDVLYTLVGSYGIPAHVTDDRPFCVQRHIGILRASDAVRPAYLAAVMASRDVFNQASGFATGTAQMTVPLSGLRKIKIPVPPLAEQERIVAAIGEQFSRLDAGVAALDRARRNIQRIRISILMQAWEDACSRSAQRSRSLASVLTAPLANGRSVRDGPPDGYPVLRLTSVRGGRIDVTQTKAGDWTPEEAAPFRVQAGDFLVVRGNGSKHLVGRGGLVTESSETAFPDTLIRARFDHTLILPAFAALLWDAPDIRAQIESAARTTAGIYKINQQALNALRIPVPSPEDQADIVGAAQARFVSTDAVSKDVDSVETRSSRLRSSILSAAFSGKLVPQDPSDEPASVLLERIAADRVSPNGRKPARRPRQAALL